VSRGGIFLGKWCSSFAGSSDGKMNVQSACALNTRYIYIATDNKNTPCARSSNHVAYTAMEFTSIQNAKFVTRFANHINNCILINNSVRNLALTRCAFPALALRMSDSWAVWPLALSGNKRRFRGLIAESAADEWYNDIPATGDLCVLRVLLNRKLFRRWNSQFTGEGVEEGREGP
jgi:hypothetical protein